MVAAGFPVEEGLGGEDNDATGGLCNNGCTDREKLKKTQKLSVLIIKQQIIVFKIISV